MEGRKGREEGKERRRDRGREGLKEGREEKKGENYGLNTNYITIKTLQIAKNGQKIDKIKWYIMTQLRHNVLCAYLTASNAIIPIKNKMKLTVLWVVW